MVRAQVLAVVRDNYDTLTLKLQDNLERFILYKDITKKTHAHGMLDRIIGEVVHAHQTGTKLVVQSIPTVTPR